jgi:hypothetical protein
VRWTSRSSAPSSRPPGSSRSAAVPCSSSRQPIDLISRSNASLRFLDGFATRTIRQPCTAFWFNRVKIIRTNDLAPAIKGRLIGLADRMRGNQRLVGGGANTISAARQAN